MSHAADLAELSRIKWEDPKRAMVLAERLGPMEVLKLQLEWAPVGSLFKLALDGDFPIAEIGERTRFLGVAVMVVGRQFSPRDPFTGPVDFMKVAE